MPVTTELLLVGRNICFVTRTNCGNNLVLQTKEVVMAGQRNDPQKLTRDKGISTVFLSCYAYKLNLVSKQSIHLTAARQVFLQIFFSSAFVNPYVRRGPMWCSFAS
jgi:hypothetical protein